MVSLVEEVNRKFEGVEGDKLKVVQGKESKLIFQNHFSGCSSIAVGYENNHFYSFTVYRLFGVSQLLATIGGFLSLIGGVSLISLLEILYFLGCRKMKQSLDETRVADPSNTVTKKPMNIVAKFLLKYCKFSSIHGLNNAAEGKVFGFAK